mgnify:CR=1 FL=1
MSINKLIEIPLHIQDRVTTPATKPSARRVPKDLNELNSAKSDDYLLLQRGNQTWIITKVNFLAGLSDDQAELYTFNGNAESPPVSQVPGTTPVLYTGFSSENDYNGAIPDAANNKITIAEAGIYHVFFQCSFSGTVNADWFFQLAIINTSPPTLIPRAADRKLGAGGDVGSASLGGNVRFSASDEIGIYISGTAAASIDTHQAQFTINRIG